MTRGRFLVGAVALLLIAVQGLGCTSPSPRITKRYKSLLDQASLPSGYVPPPAPSQSVFTLPIPRPRISPLEGLNERAQAELIEQLGRDLSADELLKALEPRETTTPRLDLTRVARRIVLSIENRSDFAVDRIERASTEIEFLQPAGGLTAEFISWNQFSTKYQTIDLGGIKANQAREVSFGVKLAPPQIQEIVEATAGAKSSNALEELITIQQRYVEATGALSPRTARLIQQGAPGLDLTGNLSIDVSIELGGGSGQTTSLKVYFVSKLFDKDGKPRPPDDVAVRDDTLTYLTSAYCEELSGSATLQTVVRSAIRGDASYMEGDDVAILVRHPASSQPFVLIPREVLRASAWTLRSRSGDAVHIINPDGSIGVLLFANPEESFQLRQYLLAPIHGPQLTISRMPLTLNGLPLMQSDIAGLTVRLEQLNWAAGSRCAPPP